MVRRGIVCAAAVTVGCQTAAIRSIWMHRMGSGGQRGERERAHRQYAVLVVVEDVGDVPLASDGDDDDESRMW